MSATAGFAVTRTVIDFDGTVTHDEGTDAAWRTDWLLHRINGRNVGGQPSILEFPPFADDASKPELPATFAIGYGEYRKYLAKLGKNDILGDLRPYPLFADPLWKDRPKQFIPGYYRVSPDLTYQRFRPHPTRGQSYLLEDFHDAVKRAKASRGAMRITGRAFPLVVSALTNPISSGLVVSTARWQLEWEWNQLFMQDIWEAGLMRLHGRKMKKPAKLAPLRVHSLSGPDDILYARGGVMALAKAEVMSIEAATLVDGPLRMQKHEELVVDPVGARNGEKAMYNTLIAPENDPAYVAAVGTRLAKLSGELGYAQNVKFVLFNAGTDADVAQSKWPWRFTVFHYGFGREAYESEIEVWTGAKAEDCKALLAGDWIQGAQ